MLGGGFFRGTNLEQDSRFGNKEAKLKKSLNFPPEFSQKVDMTKVELNVMKPWIHKRVVELLGMEDEVVINLVVNTLESSNSPDPRDLQIQLTGFLAKHAKVFMQELWTLLLSAQQSSVGIPAEFLEQKKQEIAARQAERQANDSIVARRAEQLIQSAVSQALASQGSHPTASADSQPRSLYLPPPSSEETKAVAASDPELQDAIARANESARSQAQRIAAAISASTAVKEEPGADSTSGDNDQSRKRNRSRSRSRERRDRDRDRDRRDRDRDRNRDRDRGDRDRRTSRSHRERSRSRSRSRSPARRIRSDRSRRDRRRRDRRRRSRSRSNDRSRRDARRRSRSSSPSSSSVSPSPSPSKKTKPVTVGSDVKAEAKAESSSAPVIAPESQPPSELEQQLREKALQSVKKARSSTKDE